MAIRRILRTARVMGKRRRRQAVAKVGRAAWHGVPMVPPLHEFARRA